MNQPLADVGMVGLGTMGGNLVLNLVDHGFTVAGLDRSNERLRALQAAAPPNRIVGDADPRTFVRLLKPPRAIFVLVPAGAAVDEVIAQLAPLLAAGDLLVDAGNSHFHDTDRRSAELAPKGLHFFGMGVSGGEHGARHGPSLMPGGPRAAYERIRRVLDAVAAKVDGEPCAEWLGNGAAGHYVKMVHNGIEYGLMQLIAETYDVLRRLAGLSNDALQRTFAEWNQGELASFLVEITSKVFSQRDAKTSQHLVDLILDVAQQKGTGQWTSQEALALRVPTPNIDAAVAMRVLSGRRDIRQKARELYPAAESAESDPGLPTAARGALYLASVLTYGQGLALLRAASKAYGYDLQLEQVAKVWRGGCIIRAALLEDIRAAYRRDAGLPDLVIDPALAAKVALRLADLRIVVQAAVRAGLAVPGLSAALGYVDALRAHRLPLNLVQAQRDYFGAHTYERIDEPGTFHTNWGS
ncbi:MAG: NADP-dependent phosphogluconate dehydrogenase [Phycisphaerae bacterium]|jgi:6-phosphogluconate dehydrogenase|nr:NADP-dependent phosphogluconate dehydrogenase [Phycisphaerae bacterium]MCZ2399912.1 NADP-dependent phosphogluconate dehydrogenase [Phycisphaerae bacterium]